MNCEHCGRYLKDETCVGCGAANPYLHRSTSELLRNVRQIKATYDPLPDYQTGVITRGEFRQVLGYDPAGYTFF
jgi:hypothetical protein